MAERMPCRERGTTGEFSLHFFLIPVRSEWQSCLDTYSESHGERERESGALVIRATASSVERQIFLRLLFIKFA